MVKLTFNVFRGTGQITALKCDPASTLASSRFSRALNRTILGTTRINLEIFSLVLLPKKKSGGGGGATLKGSHLFPLRATPLIKKEMFFLYCKYSSRKKSKKKISLVSLLTWGWGGSAVLKANNFSHRQQSLSFKTTPVVKEAYMREIPSNFGFS